MKTVKKTNIDIKKAIQNAKNINAKVGFFSSSKYEDGTPVAQVAIQNEYGNPQKGQPPRAFMRPAMDNQDVWKKLFLKASKISFKTGDFRKPFQLVAMTVQGNIKENIANLTSPALAQSTIDARKRRNSNKNPAKTIEKPLVDTGYMLSQVQYEVTKW